MNPAFKIICLIFTCAMMACSSPSNKRAVSIDELEKVQAAEQKEIANATATRAVLSASELIQLSDCNNLSCVQLYMKDRSPDFVHAQKGEFASQRLAPVTDTAGGQLQMPVSTFYVATNPQEQWRAAHTIHDRDAGDRLFAEFHQLGFRLVDSGYFIGIKSMQQRFASNQYPGRSLYVTSTFEPWYRKGLYTRKVTWPCYVFEVYKD